ncbi:thiamine phosphate synthase [Mucilaginibacter sabulilitoris]|uniref:Thiamine phosphate synthase n=1 Tax=Mucilaginibacter sabulilitoris TaxID=1173583 RepID=A0ABZ0TH41_9SPHI|nr:thiamine phosphate synthase [Mucilaginibacter sabulilitoris]WPU92094.1 thiamine phosphate synthase [Mucilaginibacter sabulilitoris]
MQLIVISNPEAIPNEAGIINQLFEAGLTRLHVRKPGYGGKQVAALLTQIDEPYRHYIALHQHHALAQDFGIERLHYTEQERINTDAGKLAAQNKQGYILSTSIHNMAALPSLKWFDNAFLSPVFNSISKPGYMTNLAESFYLDNQGKNLNVIALGGIDISNINKIKAMNFDGVAVLGTIWNEPQIALSNFKNLKQELQILTENHDNR